MPTPEIVSTRERSIESEREELLREAQGHVSDEVKLLIDQVRRFAPPLPQTQSDDEVSAEGTCYAHQT
jgi:hypothetical protein